MLNFDVDVKILTLTSNFDVDGTNVKTAEEPGPGIRSQAGALNWQQVKIEDFWRAQEWVGGRGLKVVT